MPKLHVHTKFTLRADDGTTKEFPVGLHDFSKSEADHWYVGLHAAEPKSDDAPALSEKDADALGELEVELKTEAERLATLAASLDKRSDELDARAADLDKRQAELLAVADEIEKAKVAADAAEKASATQSKASESKPGNSKK